MSEGTALLARLQDEDCNVADWVNAALAPALEDESASLDELGSNLVLQLQLRHLGESGSRRRPPRCMPSHLFWTRQSSRGSWRKVREKEKTERKTSLVHVF